MATAKAFALLTAGAACVAALGACGKQEDLKPVAGQAPPPLPVGAKTQPTTEELTTPDAQASSKRIKTRRSAARTLRARAASGWSVPARAAP